MAFYRPIYSLSSESITLIEKIARLEGEIRGSARDINSDSVIQVEAAIDAVHYSTRIEGNALTREQVTKALTGRRSGLGHRERDIKEVLNYSKARRYLFDEASRRHGLTVSLVFEVHRILVGGILSGKLRGHFREAQNVIKDSKTRSIIYFPPEAKDVPALMESLCKGITRDLRAKEISPLILAAAFHYQFVTIHPFMDGNGRAARLLATYILNCQGYEFAKYASIEKQHETNRSEYYSELHRLQAQNFYEISPGIDIGPWVLYWLRCVSRACEEAHGKVQKIVPSADLALPRRLQKAIGLFSRHKRLSAADYQQLTGLGRTQAVSDLKQLEQEGWIRREGGGRSTVYLWFGKILPSR